MTDRLYYHDPYLADFDARVVERGRWGDAPAVALDRTAFYAEGGGQPADRGTLSDVPVVDVQVADGRLWHVLAAEISGEMVHGVVDWARRFDHMQQHSGQHILSQAFIVTAGAETVAFHLGADAATIDLDRTGIDDAALSAVEAAANRIVMEDHPVVARFVAPEELSALPLRRPPKVQENIRIVEVEGFDWSACGGTHVRATGAVGLIKVIKAERRGEETRVTFLCGQRSLADYARKHALLQRLLGRFTCAEDELEAAVERLDAEGRTARRSLRAAEMELVRYEADARWAAATVVGDLRVVTHLYSDRPWEWVRNLAQSLCDRAQTVVMLALGGASPQWVFTRSQDVGVDMGALLRVAMKVSGGRGGGRPDWAQGGGGDPARSEEALAAAMDSLKRKT